MAVLEVGTQIGMKTETFLFRSEVFDPPIDITGFAVEAVDGHVGRIDPATYRKGAHNLVVDTGHWIFAKQRRLPDEVVTRRPGRAEGLRRTVEGRDQAVTRRHRMLAGN